MPSKSDKPEDPAAYKKLLDTIAKGESKGNYNAHYGSVNNDKLKFTSMTIADVLRWQARFVANGSPSSAVGKYQIIRPTLLSLVDELKLDTKTRFDKSTQDKLAITLLKRRGLNDYKAGKISRNKFVYNLSQEWAAIPVASGNKASKSFYDGDGLNKAQLSVKEVYKGLDSLDKTKKNPNS